MKNLLDTVAKFPGMLGRYAMVLILLSFSTFVLPAWSQDSEGSSETSSESGGLKIPEGLSDSATTPTGSEKFIVEESRVGTQLERVTVYRDNGIREVYENRDVNSLLGAEDTDLGDVPNMRRWTIGSW